MVAKKKTAKKIVEKKSAGAASVAAQHPILAKAQQVNSKLIDLQREEEDALVALLKENEAITRNTVGVEMEIKRQKLMTKELSEDRSSLEKELKILDSENSKLLKEKKELDRDVKNLETECEKMISDNVTL